MSQKDEEPPDKSSIFMDYFETFRHDEWEASRLCADEMMRNIPGLSECFVLDQITLGDGQCFMTSVIQQLRRPDVNTFLTPKWQKYSRVMDPRAFKFQVRRFATTCQHPRVQNLRTDWANFTGLSFEDYWKVDHIMKKSTWADHVFIQLAAWCLELDIVIHQNIPSKPVTTMSGNLEDSDTPCNGPELHIGYLLNRHYQSLLPKKSSDVTSRPIEIKRNWKAESANKRKSAESNRTATAAKRARKFEEVETLDESKINVAVAKTTSKLSHCPVCKKSYKVLLQHIRKSEKCKRNISDYDYNALEEKSQKNRKDQKKASEEKCKKLDPEKFKENNRRKKAKQRLSNPGRSKEDNRLAKAKQRLSNPAKSREDTQVSVAKYRKKNPEKSKADTRAAVAKFRECNNEMDRLMNFRESTMYGPIFVCISCHIKCFISNVQLFNSDIIENDKFKQLGLTMKDCIEDVDLKSGVKTIYDGKVKKNRSKFICKTCLGYFKKGKIPPSSVKNSLELKDTDKDIKDQGLDLTELEGALIAKTIVFLKIFLLAKSRWTGLRDKIINVPISDQSVNNTLLKLPRTPAQAGLVGVKLKRKKEYKNAHKSQLINPEKLFRMLKKLQDSDNPDYRNIFSHEEYRSHCKIIDTSGYSLIYGEDELLEELETMDPKSSVVSDALLNESSCSSEESEDDVDSKKHSQKEKKGRRQEKGIEKHQFIYDEAVYMTDKYPEISVAPGEGETPLSILSHKNWDTRGFPHLHNADGSNGKDAERKIKLTEQRYFVQRICNKETRFAKSPAYLYSAVAYLEEKQINSNVNLAGVRGKKITTADGSTSFQLDDDYMVLENMKNTPRYWRKKKYEMLAKLDNFGPFHIFFTLSCADMRWPANFAAIMMERGYEVQFNCHKTDEDFNVEVEIREKGKDWKQLEEFLKENVEESRHELIRGNVVTATRYYHNRVKSFLRNIVLHRSSPLCVKYYTVKEEFQERGAAHTHGCFWLDTKRLEEVVNTGLHPMKGLTAAFRKLRYNEKLGKTEITSLVNFIDNFMTVCTHGNTVGKDVAEIAKEVNKHHHTKTCSKNGTGCRFHYPRPPAPHTIIMEPNKETDISWEDSRVIINKVMEVVDDDEYIEKIMKEFDKGNENEITFKENRIKRIKKVCEVAEVSYNDYIKALGMSKSGYKVVLARDLDELNINPFNKEWLRAWNGNMDIQPALDFFAVITYITDYYSKDDTGTMEVMKKIMENSEKKELQERMRQVANIFLTHRQMGEAEAVYKLIPSMTLSMSNVTCQFVQTCRKEERSIMWKKATEDQLNAGLKAMKLDKRDGLWFQQPDLWSKYLRRPAAVEELCFAQFARMYKGLAKEREVSEEDDCDNQNIEDVDDPESNPVDDDDNEKFHYIMTYRGSKEKELPSRIFLKESCIGEVSCMTKRNHPAALRFHRVKHDKDPKRFMLMELMLYYPLRNDVKEDQIEILYNEKYKDKRKVDLVKNQVMEYMEDIQEARYYVDQLQREMEVNLKEAAAVMLDPAGEQDNDDCEENGNDEHEDYQYCNPHDFTNNEDFNSERPAYRRVDIVDTKELKEKTRSLDENQREVLGIVIKYTKDIVKSRRSGTPPPKAPLVMVHVKHGEINRDYI